MLRGLALLAAIAGLLLGVAAFGYHNGWTARDRDWSKAKAGQAVAALQHQQAQAQASAQIGARHEQVRTQIQYRTRTIRELVPQYVDGPSDARCVVPAGFVRAYDAAAAGTLPDPPGGADGEPSGVPLSRVADVSIDNLGTCHELRATVLAWQAWYAAVSALPAHAPP